MKTIYEELRNVYQEIEIQNERMTLEEQSEKEKEIYLVLDVTKMLHYMAMAEGLLELEIFANEVMDGEKSIPLGNVMMPLMINVVDGCPPEMVEDLCWKQYYANRLKGYEGLEFILYLQLFQMFYTEYNSYAIQKYLFSLLPVELQKGYESYLKKFEVDNKAELEVECRKRVETYISRATPYELGKTDKAFYYVKFIENIIAALSDRNIQRILREVDNEDLEYLLLFVNADTKRAVFRNFSYRLADLIVEDLKLIKRLNEAEIRDMASPIREILSIICRLDKLNEIEVGEGSSIIESARNFLDEEQRIIQQRGKTVSN